MTAADMELRLLHAAVPADLVAALYARAEAEGKTLADLVTEALQAYVGEKLKRPARKSARVGKGSQG